jgi:hypothetical protein
VEADGSIPGPHSMLSLGSVAYLANKTLIETFSANRETLPDAGPSRYHGVVGDPTGGEGRLPERLRGAEVAMHRFVAWLKALPGKPVFVGYPAGYDFLFVYWYLMRFAGESPFSHSALDIKTYAMAMLKKDYRSVTKRSMPKRWFDRLPHTHVALDDAIEQGALFCNMLAESRR